MYEIYLEDSKYKIFVYDSAEEVLKAFAPKKKVFKGFLDDTSEVGMSRKELTEMIEEQGVWGFADSAANTINLWISEDASDYEAVWLIGHEIGHLVRPPDFELPAEIYEEEAADLYGLVALEALTILDLIRG